MVNNSEYTNEAGEGADNPFDTAPTSTAGEISSTAVALKDQAVNTSQKVLAQTKETAGKAIDRAKDRMKSQAASQKDQAVDSMSSAVRALEATSQQFRGENLALVAGYTDSLTDQIRRASDYLSDRSVEDITHDVEDFARKNPSLFIGGAFVLGIALGRFLRSSAMSTPLAAFSTDRDLSVHTGTGQMALSSPMATPLNSPMTSPLALTNGNDAA
jgi:hypothetical protein